MTNRGFSLVEVLVATAILCLLMASVFEVIDPAQGSFQAQPETADLQQRLRVASDALASAIRGAGAGSLVGPARGPLVRSLPPVMPYRMGESQNDPQQGVRYRPDVITLVSAGLTGAQATLHDGAGIGATYLTIDLPLSCPPPTAGSICGFTNGMRAVVFDGSGAWDAITITSASGTTLTFKRPGGLAFAYSPGAVISEMTIRSFSLKTDAAGVSRLSQYDGFQSEAPLVDHVVAMTFEYFGEPQPPARLIATPIDSAAGPWTDYGPKPPPLGVDDPRDAWPPGENCGFTVSDGDHASRLASLGGASLVPLTESMLTDGPWCPDEGQPAAFDADLLRVRRVRVRLRLQVASAGLRGASGSLFLKGGTSTSAERFVPDQQIEFDVAPPNMATGR